MRHNFCLCIQAGGASSRMGTDKALKLIDREPLISRVLRRLYRDELAERIHKIVVTTNHPEAYRFLEEYYRPHLFLVRDIICGLGALGGLFTALVTSKAEIVAVIACDLPFVDADIITDGYDKMVEHEYDGFVPRTGAGLEPLHALYRTRTCLPLVEEAISVGQRKVTAWFKYANIFFSDIEESEPSPFFNVNTPEEFIQAEQWAKKFDDG